MEKRLTIGAYYQWHFLQTVIAVLLLKVPSFYTFFSMYRKRVRKNWNNSLSKELTLFMESAVNRCIRNNPKLFTSHNRFIFSLNVTAIIILVSILSALLYHLGVMQRFISVIAKIYECIDARERCRSLKYNLK